MKRYVWKKIGTKQLREVVILEEAVVQCFAQQQTTNETANKTQRTATETKTTATASPIVSEGSAEATIVRVIIIRVGVWVTVWVTTVTPITPIPSCIPRARGRTRGALGPIGIVLLASQIHLSIALLLLSQALLLCLHASTFLWTESESDCSLLRTRLLTSSFLFNLSAARSSLVPRIESLRDPNGPRLLGLLELCLLEPTTNSLVGRG